MQIKYVLIATAHMTYRGGRLLMLIDERQSKQGSLVVDIYLQWLDHILVRG